jgi:PQQ-dependent catabolism-associated CXXCW motif protein
MRIASRFTIACITVLLASQMTAVHAQRTLAQLREELIAPWLITVKGESRNRLLRISEISQDTEGAFLVNGNFGWVDGTQSIARIELIQTAQDLVLIARTGGNSLISVRRSPDGSFAGIFRNNRGTELDARLEKLSEDQLLRAAQETSARMAARVFADEDKDWGVAPTKSARSGRLHAPTPMEVPGAKTIRTMELRAMQGQSPAPILIDVLDDQGHRTIPGARWLREAGKAEFGKAEMEKFREDLEKLTSGRKSAAIVFFCLNSECWLSYNAALRALELGYTNVHWFRGGTAAWNRAGFDTRETEPFRR